MTKENPLKKYLRSSDDSLAALARRMNHYPSVLHRVLKLNRLPNHNVCIALIRETRGRVTPNDFFDIDGIIGVKKCNKKGTKNNG